MLLRGVLLSLQNSKMPWQMKVARFEYNLFGVNTYVVWDPDTLDAAIIDPGMSDEREEKSMIDFIESRGLNPVHLINTHLHIDHTLGDDFIAAKYNLPLEASSIDKFLGESRDDQARMFHLRFDELPPLKIERELHDGDRIKVGNGELEVIAVPGHSPGSIALYSPADRFVITGDALFRGSIGRTDLPGGDGDMLRRSIRAKLLSLPADTTVLPGHGPSSMIATERTSNPWI